MAATLTRAITATYRCQPEALWPLLADTARFNETIGFPKHLIAETVRPDGSVEAVGSFRKGPLHIAWREIPVNWVAGQWFEHGRALLKGPFRSLTAGLALTSTEIGCEVRYTLSIEPRGLLGRALAPLVLKSGLRKFAEAGETAEAHLEGRRATVFDYRPPPPTAAVTERVRALTGEIEASGHGHGLARRLADELLSGQEVDLVHLRPLALARRWGVPARNAVELCLQATRTGLLELRWALLCPRCRAAKVATSTLDSLPKGAHCPSCNIDYERDFARSVELAFRPAPTVRAVPDGEYCFASPMSTPHVKLQVTLQPGERRRLPARLAPGPYRYRTLEPGPERELEVGPAGLPAITLTEAVVETGAPSATEILLANETGRPRTLLVEERAWVAEALTADRATTLQAFRDLFSDQVLRPGDEVAVRHVTLLFSDLRASTALYDRIGDAPAYRLVRDHFAFLAGIVRAHDGAVVKTIGDAVMAAFHRPGDGVAAALEIQRRVAEFNAAHPETPVVVKLGLHGGPSIAVTLNERLDYFGQVANLASRLQGLSEGADVVLSDSLARDPEVAPLLAGIASRAETAALKGVPRPVAFLRLAP